MFSPFNLTQVFKLFYAGSDAFVKARTGTGKSAAFLVYTSPLFFSCFWSFILLLFCFFIALVKHQQLPAIETVLKASSSNAVQRISPIYVLVLCPTRELASQIAAEATVLLKYHDGIGVQTLVGGIRFKEDQKRLELDPCQVYPSCLCKENFIPYINSLITDWVIGV